MVFGTVATILVFAFSLFIDVVHASVYLEYDPTKASDHPRRKKAPIKEIKYDSQPAFFGKRFEENVRYKARLQYLPHDEYLCNGITDPDYNHFDDDAWYVPKLQKEHDKAMSYLNNFYGPRRSTMAADPSSSLRSNKNRDRKLKVITMEEAVAKQIVEDEMLRESLKQRQQRQRTNIYDSINMDTSTQQRPHTNNSDATRNSNLPQPTSSSAAWSRKDRHRDDYEKRQHERPFHFSSTEQQQTSWWNDDAAGDRRDHDADDYLTADDHDFIFRYRHSNSVNDDLSDGDNKNAMNVQDAVDDKTMIVNKSFISRPHKDRFIDTRDYEFHVSPLVDEGYTFNKRKHRHNRDRYHALDSNYSDVDDFQNQKILPNGGVVIPPDGSPVVLLAKRGMCNFETKAKAALALMSPMERNIVHYVIVYDNSPHKRLSPMSAASGRFDGEDQIGLLFVSLDSGNDMRSKLDGQSPEVSKEGGMVVYMDAIAPWMPPNPFYNNIDGWIVVILTAIMTVMMLCGCLIMCCQTGLIRREGNVLIFGQPFAMGNQNETRNQNSSRLLTELEVLSLEEVPYTPDPDDSSVAVGGGAKENDNVNSDNSTLLSPLLLSDDRKMAAKDTNITNDGEKMPSALHEKERGDDNRDFANTMHNDDGDGNTTSDMIGSSCCNVPMCSVCLEEYEEGELLRKLPCNHTFHTDCIVPWLTERSPLCPLCKCDIYQEKFAEFDHDDEDTEQVAPRPDNDPGAEDSTVSSNDNLETLASRGRWSLFSIPRILRRPRLSLRQRNVASIEDDSDDDSVVVDSDESLLEARAIDMLPNDEESEGSDHTNDEHHSTLDNEDGNGMSTEAAEAYHHFQVAPSFETASEGVDSIDAEANDGDDVFYPAAATTRHAAGTIRRRQASHIQRSGTSDGHPGAHSTAAALPLLLDEVEEVNSTSSSDVAPSSNDTTGKKKSWLSSFFFGSFSNSDFENNHLSSTTALGEDNLSNTETDNSAENQMESLSSPLLSNQ